MNTQQPQVLLVEDEPLVREMMKDILSDLGNAVIECDRADAGLACLELKADDIALLVTDILTPGSLNGHQLAQIASLRWPRLKILITSGYADASTHHLPPNSAFITKPWTYQQLEEAVQALMQ